MKNKKKLFVLSILGGIVLVVLAANGFRLPGDYTPKNRTREQYDFENQFTPIVEFLGKEKKDFTKIETYKSSILNSQGEFYRVFLYVQNVEGDSNYEVEIGDKKQVTSVTYSESGLQYETEIFPKYDEEILNMVLSKDYLASLDVKEIFKSSETEISSITYYLDNQSDFSQKMKKKFNLPDETRGYITLSKTFRKSYDISIDLTSKEKSITIDNQITVVQGGGN